MASQIDSYQVSLKLFLKNKEGKILVLHTIPKNGQIEKLDIPGGRIDENEFSVSFENILRRELGEELGDDLVVDISSKPIGLGRKKYSSSESSKEFSILFIFFEGTFHEGEIHICDEYSGFSWVSPKESELENQFITGLAEGLKNLTP